MKTPPMVHPDRRARAVKGCGLSRRAFLESAGLATAAVLSGSAAEIAQPSRGAGFVHRGYNGWITDLATEPDPQAAWPSLRLDDRLLADYREKFRLMQRLGMNEIVVWGLYVANNWPVDLAKAVSPERGRLVEQLIDSAHEHGLKVLSGLGTYSWGFAEILRAEPQLRGTNANALCASEPGSHAWMQRVVDYMVHRFAIDGVSMQSADQGRCKCPRCAVWGEAEYHTRLNRRVAEYIRDKWPRHVLGMSNWGLPFHQPKDRRHFQELSGALDYMIDQNNSAAWPGRDFRRDFIAGLHCGYGTTGGPVVEPPQHWARDRWFLPTCRRVHAHMQQLAADGGRACEFFYHILANPSSEVTFHVAARTMADPKVSLDGVMEQSIEELYAPKDAGTCRALAAWFLEAEEAYFQFKGGNPCGTLSLEPLVGNKPGPPVYLRDGLKPEQRALYGEAVERLAEAFQKLRSGLRSESRVARVRACLANVLADVKNL